MGYDLSEKGRLQKIKNLKGGMKGKKHSAQTILKMKKKGIPLHKAKATLCKHRKRYYLHSQGRSVLRSHYNWCIANSWNYIPQGCVVHHIDLDKLNDGPHNLAILPIADHTKLHNYLRSLKNPNEFRYIGKNLHLKGGEHNCR